MPMNTKSFPKATAAQKGAAKSMRKAFGGDEDEPKPAPVGHTRLDEDQESGGSFASRVTASIKRRVAR